MKRRTLAMPWIGCCLLLAVGCGIPEVVVDAARSETKQAVEEMVDELMDQFIGDLLDPENLPLPFDDGGSED